MAAVGCIVPFPEGAIFPEHAHDNRLIGKNQVFEHLKTMQVCTLIAKSLRKIHEDEIGQLRTRNCHGITSGEYDRKAEDIISPIPTITTALG